MNYKEYNELTELIKNRFKKFYNAVNVGDNLLTNLNDMRITIIGFISSNSHIAIFFPDNTNMIYRVPIKLFEMTEDEFEEYLETYE